MAYNTNKAVKENTDAVTQIVTAYNDGRITFTKRSQGIAKLLKGCDDPSTPTDEEWAIINTALKHLGYGKDD